MEVGWGLIEKYAIRSIAEIFILDFDDNIW